MAESELPLVRPFSTVPRGESRTKQSMQAECDINNIMKKYEKSGLIGHVSKYQGRYEDLPGELDYQAGLNAIMAAQDAFESLPAEIRSQFENDPSKFLAFVEDEDNLEEMVELGLANADQLPVQDPPDAEPLPDPSPPADPPA